ncbi:MULTISPECIES: fumarylacetoacetate hydrolase family protein [unclassified Exiguobacterium]|uniref:fumarylacetoacetate hydrolase family protein n=1 Tax=unclassified Exiguobacterium TaxID=2644629 RepID=UPI0010394BF4|nr:MULTISPECIES: fumarylacetoacetate hydrolase family protein [unclassified Exiguobacterium]TCI35615.1 FAA hydrolase family protein [Exiguobacterium sp. SH4S7]TCI43589.1 FAA hydrolase family protein [Exiguobacterium sp. SH5S32]TCI52535.1 FAA hydrolase family protein [Exiguobacterium sp. SH1S4]TCI65307.1 FAA hydrolase family protein [Exiguobacterium sp. SH0S2]TCI68844.1 FAA hydrolase family protein [Exiguobacterium sp. SH1S1]
MKWCSYEIEGETRVGVVEADQVYDVSDQLHTNSLLEVIAREFKPDIDLDVASVRALEDVKLQAPYRPLKNVICIGKNYEEHVKEMDTAGAGKLVIFTKAPTSVVGPDAIVERHAALTDQLDYEGELAVIIGKSGRDIQDVEDHIFGYTIINDITARDVQKQHVQFFRGKSFDTFCPFGPFIVTPEELEFPLSIRTDVNGENRQLGSTDDMIRPIDELIRTLSAGMTLEAGDIIATGTPAGVGHGMKPPVYLQSGDRVEVTISGLGTLRNDIV